MKKNNKIELSTLIGKDSSIVGEINISGGIRIDGTIEGSLKSDGLVIIGTSGIAKANIISSDCIVSGKIFGDVTIDGTLELRSSAIVEGNVKAKNLKIDIGASLNGYCLMKNNEDKNQITEVEEQ